MLKAVILSKNKEIQDAIIKELKKICSRSFWM